MGSRELNEVFTWYHIKMSSDWKSFGFVVVLITIFIRVNASNPPDKQDHPSDSFWFGTQSLLCMTSKSAGPLPHLRTRRSVPTDRTPDRSSLRYIHRLIYYNDTVFEWGTGVRGYHTGPAASVTDCPVIWESSPAGRGRCPIEALVNYTRLYRSRFGPYHLLTNNCHHFSNRVSAILVDRECGRVSDGSERVDDGIVSVVERALWRLVGYVLSYVDPVVERLETGGNAGEETGYVVE